MLHKRCKGFSRLAGIHGDIDDSRDRNLHDCISKKAAAVVDHSITTKLQIRRKCFI